MLLLGVGGRPCERENPNEPIVLRLCLKYAPPVSQVDRASMDCTANEVSMLKTGIASLRTDPCISTAAQEWEPGEAHTFSSSKHYAEWTSCYTKFH